MQKRQRRETAGFGRDHAKSEWRKGELVVVDVNANGVFSGLVGVEEIVRAGCIGIDLVCRRIARNHTLRSLVGNENPRVDTKADRQPVAERNGIIKHIEEQNAKGAARASQQRAWKPLDRGLSQVQMSRKHTDATDARHARDHHMIDGNE